MHATGGLHRTGARLGGRRYDLLAIRVSVARLPAPRSSIRFAYFAPAYGTVATMSDRSSVQDPTLLDRPAAPALRASGRVEAVHIRRRSRKHPELLLFKGTPASKHSVAKSLVATVVGPGEPLPPPWIDMEKGRIHLFYSDADHRDLVALREDPASQVCYLWISADGLQSHAWLLRTR